jgi:hypothetical protein
MGYSGGHGCRHAAAWKSRQGESGPSSSTSAPCRPRATPASPIGPWPRKRARRREWCSATSRRTRTWVSSIRRRADQRRASPKRPSSDAIAGGRPRSGGRSSSSRRTRPCCRRVPSETRGAPTGRVTVEIPRIHDRSRLKLRQQSAGSNDIEQNKWRDDLGRTCVP